MSGRRTRQRAHVAWPSYVPLLTQACPHNAHVAERLNVCHATFRPYQLTDSPPSDASVADREARANTDIRLEADEWSPGRKGWRGLSRLRGKAAAWRCSR